MYINLNNFYLRGGISKLLPHSLGVLYNSNKPTGLKNLSQELY